ncbi:MAG: hypothetical protein KGN84_15995 [Acidobacteriota bacterium]|nr:hypothetical protein [Acidobacteriota bacterium]
MATGALAQDQPPAPNPPNQTPHAWRTADATPAPTRPDMTPDQAPPPPPPPNFSAPPANLPDPNTPLPPSSNPASGPYAPAPLQRIPAHLAVKPGTYVSIRMGQALSSDHNRQGDTFVATLADPLVVDGIVVAQRGQTVYGRVTEAQKAGRIEGTSRLGVELTGLTLVDGQQVSVQSQMLNGKGDTSVGRDTAAVAGTTAIGAAIGAGADWGRGAAIGAGAGALAGLIGVLVTRGHQTVIYPESVLTFRIASPIDIATSRAPQAFRYVTGQDYSRPAYTARRPSAGYAAPAPAPVPYPGYYYGPAYYPYPYYWGPGFSLFVGPGFGYHRFRR